MFEENPLIVLLKSIASLLLSHGGFPCDPPYLQLLWIGLNWHRPLLGGTLRAASSDTGISEWLPYRSFGSPPDYYLVIRPHETRDERTERRSKEPEIREKPSNQEKHL